MTTLGNSHDSTVKDWANSYIPDLKTQEDSSPPLCIEQGRSFIAENNVNHNAELDEADSDSEQFSDTSSAVSSNEYSYSSSSDDNYDDDEYVCISEMSDLPLVLLTACPPQVLELCHHITQLPGLPIVMKHKGYRLVGDNIDKNIQKRHLRLDRRNQSINPSFS